MEKTKLITLLKKLDKPKIRGLILYPPIVLITASMIYGFCAIIFKFSVHPLTLPIYLYATGYLMIGLVVILSYDFLTMKNKH